ncbi:MAG: type VI secretion system baseplate subunit TssG [Kiloniellales bacterium]
MAPEDRPSSSGLAEPVSETEEIDGLALLREAPHKVDFFAAGRLLECSHRDRPRLGASLRASDDPVRFEVPVELTFAPSTLAGLTLDARGIAHLQVRMFGLTGPNGALPLHITEYARDRQRSHGDATLAAFLDVFHHRMISFFYRAWATGKAAVALDRPDADYFAPRLAALSGLGMPSLRNRDALPDFLKLRFTGRLAAQTRNAEGLEAMVRAALKVPARLLEFVGQWLPLARDERTRLGGRTATSTLGRTALLGERVWSVQHAVRLELGPLSLAEYEGLLPGGRGLAWLRAILRGYLGEETDCEVNLILAGEEVPTLALGRGQRLGWTTWLPRTPGTDWPTEITDLVLRAGTLQRQTAGTEGSQQQERDRTDG